MWFAFAAGAAEPVVVPEAEVRPRAEADTGRDGDLATGSAAGVTQRTRIGVRLDAGLVGARVVVQDVRAWGSENDTLDYAAEGLDLHVGTLSIATEAVDLTVGRQEIALHEHRLIGNVDWAQQARAFDAARLAWSAGELSGDLVGALLREGSAFDAAHDGDLVAARAGWAREAQQLDVLGVWDHQGAARLDRFTSGIYTKGAAGVLSGRLEAYAQVGRSGDAAIAAGLVGVAATIAPEVALEPEVTLWYDVLSGDPSPGKGRVTSFSTLYATNHKFYGLIDVAAFREGGPADGSGLHDAAMKLATRPSEPLTLHLDLHHFARAAPADALAFEPDAWVDWKVAPALSLAGGASAWLPYDDRDPDLWGWLQLQAKLPR